MDKFSYRGYRLLWTGWKTIANQLEICGQWVAIPIDKDKDWLHVSMPGAEGIYRRGNCISLCHFANQPWIDFTSTFEEKVQAVELARQRMLRLIDAAIEDRIDEHVEDSLYPGRREVKG